MPGKRGKTARKKLTRGKSTTLRGPRYSKFKGRMTGGRGRGNTPWSYGARRA